MRAESLGASTGTKAEGQLHKLIWEAHEDVDKQLTATPGVSYDGRPCSPRLQESGVSWL